MYQVKTARNKALLMRRLVNMKLKHGTSVAEHTSEFQSLINQLSSVEMPLGDEMQALLLLSSLPDNWETLVVSLSNSAPNGNLTMPMVKDALFNEEARRKDIDHDQSHALVIERGRQQRKSQGRRRGRSKSREKSANGRKPSYKYYHCSMECHLKKNCRKLQREQGQSSSQSKEKDGDTLVTTHEEVTICSILVETCLHVSGQEDNEWVVDTAASYHATSRRNFFTNYKARDFGVLKMRNTSSSEIIGIGDIQIQTNVGSIITLKDVRHVPELRLNLIFGIALDKQGYESHFKNCT